MSGRLAGEELRLCMAWLGPWLVGGCLELLLQGILFCQFVNYFTYYHDDNRTLRAAVVGLFVLTVLKSLQSFALVWIQFIVYFGDVQGAILLNYTTWWQAGNPLMVAVIGLYVQTYFCFRLWVISKKWYVAAPMVVLFVFGFFSIVVGTYFISTQNKPQITVWFAAHLCSILAGDAILMGLSAYFLLMSKKDVLPQTAGLLNALVRLTFQTAAPAAICALFNFAFSRKNPGGTGLTGTAFNMIQPKLYAISMMWTLNARRTIRAAHRSNGTSSNEFSGGRSRITPRRQGDMELGQIQVLTQTEITQHIDVRDMFDPTQPGVGEKRGHGQALVDTKKSDDDSVHYST